MQTKRTIAWTAALAALLALLADVVALPMEDLAPPRRAPSTVAPRDMVVWTFWCFCCSFSRYLRRLTRTLPARRFNSMIWQGTFWPMKTEMSWRNAPFRNSGFRKLKPFAGYFTHES